MRIISDHIFKHALISGFLFLFMTIALSLILVAFEKPNTIEVEVIKYIYVGERGNYVER